MSSQQELTTALSVTPQDVTVHISVHCYFAGAALKCVGSKQIHVTICPLNPAQSDNWLGGILSKAKILAVCAVFSEDYGAVRSNISSKLGQQHRGKPERGLRKTQLEKCTTKQTCSDMRYPDAGHEEGEFFFFNTWQEHLVI